MLEVGTKSGTGFRLSEATWNMEIRILSAAFSIMCSVGRANSAFPVAAVLRNTPESELRKH